MRSPPPIFEGSRSEHGFVLEAIEPQVIRQQDGMDVPGYFVMLRRA